MVLDHHVLALDGAGFVEAFAECSDLAHGGLGRPGADEADDRQRRRLPERRQRPRRRCAAEQRKERAAFHSITSSARASTVAGMSRPIDPAIFKLITSSNLVGACTGISAGFSPLRMRST